MSRYERPVIQKLTIFRKVGHENLPGIFGVCE